MTQENRTARRLENLLYKKIVTADGKTIGHVFDVQLSRDGTFRITALMYGGHSLLYRLHVYHAFAQALHLKQQPKTIPWEAVEKFDNAAVHLKPGFKPESAKPVLDQAMQ